MNAKQHNTPEVQVRHKGRRQLIFLLVIFFAPLAIAWLMFYGVIDWRPSDSSANGELYAPAVPLPAAVPVYLLKTYDGDFLRQRWTLVYVGSGPCDDSCEQTLQQMSQVHARLGKYSDRIGRAMIVASDVALPGPAFIDTVARRFPGLEIVAANALGDAIVEQRPAADSEWIYLVDPLGNLVMRFAAEQGPRPMYDDMKRLLRLSRIG